MVSPTRLLSQQRQRDALRHQGFTPAQIRVLFAYRAAYQTGQFAQDTPRDPHLLFGRWLYEHGKISG